MIEELIAGLTAAGYLAGAVGLARRFIRSEYERLGREFAGQKRTPSGLAKQRKIATFYGLRTALVWPVPLIAHGFTRAVFSDELVEEERARNRAIIEADEERERKQIEAALAEAEPKPIKQAPDVSRTLTFSTEWEARNHASAWARAVENNLEEAIALEKAAEAERRRPPYTNYQLFQLQRIAEGIAEAEKNIERLTEQVRFIDQTLTLGESSLDASAHAASIEARIMDLSMYITELRAIRDGIHRHRGQKTRNIIRPLPSVD